MTDANTDLERRRAVGGVTLRGAAPAALARIINMDNWALSLLTGVPYVEPDPEFISRMLAFQVITAETVDDIFRQLGIRKLQEIIPNTPDANTGPLRLLDLYVASSDFESGNPCYMICTVLDKELNEEYKFTTGATNPQSTMLALIDHGAWPIDFQIKRGDNKDKGGRYLLTMQQPD